MGIGITDGIIVSSKLLRPDDKSLNMDCEHGWYFRASVGESLNTLPPKWHNFVNNDAAHVEHVKIFIP